MTRTQSFKALVGQSFMDRLALTTYQPKHSLNHQPDDTARIMQDREIDNLLNRASLIRPQAF